MKFFITNSGEEEAGVGAIKISVADDPSIFRIIDVNQRVGFEPEPGVQMIVVPSNDEELVPFVLDNVAGDAPVQIVGADGESIISIVQPGTCFGWHTNERLTLRQGG